jgi:hypothetical protein
MENRWPVRQAWFEGSIEDPGGTRMPDSVMMPKDVDDLLFQLATEATPKLVYRKESERIVFEFLTDAVKRWKSVLKLK